MINASKEFKEKLKNGANIVNYADITLVDGTVLNLTYKDFMIGGCAIEDRTTDGKFGVGFVIGKTLSIRLENHDERFSQYDFYGATINLYVAMQLDNGSIEKIRKGVYYAMVPQTPGDIIEISATDGMYRLDRDYSESTTTYPATLQTIITDACIDCGIPIGFTQFDNMGFIVREKPESVTYRQVISWASQIAGYNARIDNNRYMQLVWYNSSLLDWNHYEGGDFKVYPHGTVLDGGNFRDYSKGLIISGGLFTDEMPEHVFRIKELSVHTDDVQITGVRVAAGDDVSELFGEEGYVIEINDNPFAAGSERQVADYLGNRMVGMVFRPFSAQVLNNPLYEPFDIVRVSDRKGNVYTSLINSVSYTVGEYTQISCEAEDPLRNGSVYFSEAARAVVEARRNTEKQITDYDKAVQNMNALAMNALGFFETIETSDDGSRITYMHDKPTLSESSTIYKRSIDGFFVSQDGGKSYTAGFDKNGNEVVNVLYAIGIVADWIRSGRLEVKKGSKTTFLADCDTGEVKIVADSFSLSSGQTIDSIAEAKAEAEVNNFVSSVYNPEIANLQSQIDGQIETWYYDYEPTLNNAPASGWKTEADRARHEGDLFYWKSKGYSYRFFKDGSTWKWQLITDSDITKALAEAAAAQDTADNKRRVFVAQPAPPYDIGDLWVQGSGGDILRSKVSRQSGSYAAADWIKASKYTDDSALEAFIDGEFAESIEDLQAQADKKAETWYQTADPSTAWTTAALKSEHIGDIWFNSTNTVQKSYRWSGTKWVEMKTTPPPEVFDEIDGKAQVFVAQPAPPYDIGDLWFNSATSDIMTCVKARASGNYAASDWQKRNKYIDQSDANSAAQNAVDAQTQLDIFNKLTNNGALQGIYMQDGKLYVNATYIVAGKISSKNGKVYFDLDNSELACSRIIDRSNENITIGGVSYANLVAQMQAVNYTNRENYGLFLTKEGNNDYGILISPSVPGGDVSSINSGKGLYLRGGPGRYGYPLIRLEPDGGATIETEGNSALVLEDDSFTLQCGNGGYIQTSENFHTISGTVEIKNGSFKVYGTKNRIVETKDYGNRLLYCYETAKPYFGDIGEGTLDESGICYVFTDDIFGETVNTSCQYQIFIQKYGQGDAWVETRSQIYFSVRGTPGLRFGWELKARQVGYESERLEKNLLEEYASDLDYVKQAQEYIDGFFSQILEGRIA